MTTSAPEPSLSIVVPVHRAEAYLPRCLGSILSAPAPDLEVVVVDDASPDRSGTVAHAYAAADPRLRVLRLPTSVGPGRARNHGLAHTRGAYLWFVDADDWLPPGAVTAVLTRLAATHPDVLVVDHADVSPDGRVKPGTPPGALAADARAGGPGPLARHPGLLRLAHSACTKLIRRGFLDEIGLRFHPGWYEDSAFNHPLLLAAPRIDALDRVCYYYRHRPNGTITTSVSARHFAAFAQYERMWAAARRTGEAYERFRPELFRLMMDHLLVIAGSDHRLPRSLRRDFFRRLARVYRTHVPPGGYPRPPGIAGLKHRLVSWDAYEAYAALRLGWRAAGKLRRGAARHARTAPPRPQPRTADAPPPNGRRRTGDESPAQSADLAAR